MLRRCVMGLFVVSFAVAVVVAGRGDSTIAQTNLAKNAQPNADLPPENGKQSLKPVNPLPIGQVVLFNPIDVDASIGKKLKDIELSGTSVKVTGTLNTFCSDTQLKAETMGCRRFDLTKPILDEPLDAELGILHR